MIYSQALALLVIVVIIKRLPYIVTRSNMRVIERKQGDRW